MESNFGIHLFAEGSYGLLGKEFIFRLESGLLFSQKKALTYAREMLTEDPDLEIKINS